MRLTRTFKEGGDKNGKIGQYRNGADDERNDAPN